jgi:hypothetical protein
MQIDLIFKIKHPAARTVERHTARLVAKGFTKILKHDAAAHPTHVWKPGLTLTIYGNF